MKLKRISVLSVVVAAFAVGLMLMATAVPSLVVGLVAGVFVDRFELGVCPVTRAEYERFVDATKHELPRDWSHPLFAHADLPVVGVSWIDAVAYCAWRSEQDGRPVRLPTEAEWEFAARGRQEALFPWGDVMPEWIPNGGRGPLQAPWPVTLGEPTDFGLLGIATNVHEWCADWHDKDYYSRSPERNPAGPNQGVRRAARGGHDRRHACLGARCSAGGASCVPEVCRAPRCQRAARRRVRPRRAGTPPPADGAAPRRRHSCATSRARRL